MTASWPPTSGQWNCHPGDYLARHARRSKRCPRIQLGARLQLVLAQSPQRLDLPPPARRGRAQAGARARSPGGRGSLRRDARVGSALARCCWRRRPTGRHHGTGTAVSTRGPDPRPPRPLPLSGRRGGERRDRRARRRLERVQHLPNIDFRIYASGGAVMPHHAPVAKALSEQITAPNSERREGMSISSRC